MTRSLLFAIACLAAATWMPGAQAQQPSAGAKPPAAGYGQGAPPPEGAAPSEMVPWPVLLVTRVEVLQSTHGGGLDIVRARGVVTSSGWGAPHLVPITRGEPVDGSKPATPGPGGAPKPATHRRPKPATMWGVLGGRIVLFDPVGKGCDQVVAV